MPSSPSMGMPRPRSGKQIKRCIARRASEAAASAPCDGNLPHHELEEVMTGVIELLDGEISQRHMLNHPFYQRWNAGELTRGELEEYSRQYYPYTLAFPTFLSAMHAHTDDIAIRQYLLENLIEEERGTENHPELWLRFCEALGVDRSDAKSATPNAATA